MLAVLLVLGLFLFLISVFSPRPSSWLLEINASPSLTASSKEDYDLKFGLLNDVVNILDMDNKWVARSGDRRVMYKWVARSGDRGVACCRQVAHYIGGTLYERVANCRHKWHIV